MSQIKHKQKTTATMTTAKKVKIKKIDMTYNNWHDI